jgi:hypothetical protein
MKGLVFAAVLNLSVSSIALAAPCDLSPVVSKTVIAGTTNVAGANMPYKAHPSWSFKESADGSTAIITEKVDVELPALGQKILSLASNSSGLPNRDCDVTSSITGGSVTPRQPSLLVHVDFSGTKWLCTPGIRRPCTSFKYPFRMCNDPLVKTIGAAGTGSADASLTPAFAGQAIKVDQHVLSQQFHMSKGTALGLSFLFGPGVGVALSQLNLGGLIKIPYQPIVIPADQLAAADQNAPVEFDWQNSAVYFSSYGGNIALTRERTLEERINTTCYLRGVLSKF